MYACNVSTVAYFQSDSSETQLAKGLFLRNAFIRRQFVAGSWVVSRGWVTLLKGGRN